MCLPPPTTKDIAMRIKIKQLEERVSTSGLHMGGDERRRKLEPGEIVEIPEDMEHMGLNLCDILFNTGKVEITREPINRPLDYESYRQARLCSPTFKPRGPDEEIEVENALAQVASLLTGLEEVAPEATGSPATERQPAAAPPPPSAPQRRKRRSTASTDEQEDTARA